MFKWESNKGHPSLTFSLILIFSIWIQIEKSNEKDIYDEDYVDNDPAEASVEYYEGKIKTIEGGGGSQYCIVDVISSVIQFKYRHFCSIP